MSTSPPDALRRWFEVDEVLAGEIPPSWNVAPTDPVYAVGETAGRRVLRAVRWGLVPSWAGSAKVASRFINARGETLTDRRAFADAFHRRRCIVPADGFYEWQPLDGGPKQPVLIRPAGGGVLAFAGLFEVWDDPGRPGREPLRTCTIVTTTANSLISPIHDRMPVILARAAWAEWLDRAGRDPAPLRPLLRPAPNDLLEIVPVRTLVNDVRNNGPELIEPLPG